MNKYTSKYYKQSPCLLRMTHEGLYAAQDNRWGSCYCNRGLLHIQGLQCPACICMNTIAIEVPALALSIAPTVHATWDSLYQMHCYSLLSMLGAESLLAIVQL